MARIAFVGHLSCFWEEVGDLRCVRYEKWWQTMRQEGSDISKDEDCWEWRRWVWIGVLDTSKSFEKLSNDLHFHWTSGGRTFTFDTMRRSDLILLCYRGCILISLTAVDEKEKKVALKERKNERMKERKKERCSKN